MNQDDAVEAFARWRANEEPPSEDKVRSALERWRGKQFAELGVILFGLMAQYNADELRTALASVFDLRSIQHMTKRVMRDMQAAQRLATEVREIYYAIQKDLERLEDQFDGLRHELERLRQVVKNPPERTTR